MDDVCVSRLGSAAGARQEFDKLFIKTKQIRFVVLLMNKQSLCIGAHLCIYFVLGDAMRCAS